MVNFLNIFVGYSWQVQWRLSAPVSNQAQADSLISYKQMKAPTKVLPKLKRQSSQITLTSPDE